jgi:hypothetical protein
MQSAELRELTASEELTLEQEYAMQRKRPSTFPHVPLLDQTWGPTRYGGKQEVGRRTKTVRDYIHRYHPTMPHRTFFLTL